MYAVLWIDGKLHWFSSSEIFVEKDNLSWLSRQLDFFPKLPEWPAGMINGQFGAVLIMRHVTLIFYKLF